MTSSPTRVTRRKRGRPPEDVRDQLITDAAEALDVIYGLGRQTARDLAVHFLEHKPDVETGKLTFTDDEVRGIGDAVLRKKYLRPRNTMVAALILMSMGEAAIRMLLTLDAVGAQEHVRRLIASVAHSPHIYRMKQKKKKRTKSK